MKNGTQQISDRLVEYLQKHKQEQLLKYQKNKNKSTPVGDISFAFDTLVSHIQMNTTSDTHSMNNGEGRI